MEFQENGKSEEICPKCHGTGIVKEPDGTIHTCWKCLEEGKLDCHTKNLPDHNLKV